MVNFEITPNILAAAALASKKSLLVESWFKEYLETYETQFSSIPHFILAIISETLIQDNYPIIYSLSYLTCGSKMVFQGPKPRVKSPELLAILAKIEIENQNKEYNRMVSTVLPQNSSAISSMSGIGHELKESTKVLTAIFNVLLSVGAVVTAILYFGDGVSTDISVVGI
ncbi:hypothetical protein HK096_000792 [Nowakowskiella sp. JEL0078]|nr:hypothetical protein HK096_000792 [Nowakowskiella sp. JEL0078]